MLPRPKRISSGASVGPYTLLNPIGEGGMGQVWAASKGAEVFALKLLIGEDFTSEKAELFFDEAKAASALAHDAIVKTHDFGRAGTIHYLAMEMVPGPTLKELLDGRRAEAAPISPLVIAYIGMRLASALHYAHAGAVLDGKRLELVHRDVSPHNVLIDPEGRIFLTDFGVARTAIQAHQTTAGTVRGKPSYMAPEQVVGDPVDPRTDVFALGSVLYEAATLRRLFSGKRPADRMKAVLTKVPRPLTEMVPDFPNALWKLIGRALEKRPEQRFASAADLHQRLSAFVHVNGGVVRAKAELAAMVAEHRQSDHHDTIEDPALLPRFVSSFDTHPTCPELPEPTITSPFAFAARSVPIRGLMSVAILALACASGIGISVAAFAVR
jgi:serine/threonine-protein kinase